MDVYTLDKQSLLRLKANVERLESQYRNLVRGLRNHQYPDDSTRNYICQTPVGGIAARSGTTVSSATCPVYYIDGTTLTAAGFSVTVYNLSATAVAGSVYITTNKDQVSGKHIAIFEDCT